MQQSTMGRRTLLAELAALLLLAGCSIPAIAPGGPREVRQTTIGRVLVDAHGMTLYTYAKDEAGHSTCNGFCAVAWPPAKASKSDSPQDGFTIIRRDDGSLQWAYGGMPLYGYIRDSMPGDTTGEGVDGVWHAAKP